MTIFTQVKMKLESLKYYKKPNGFYIFIGRPELKTTSYTKFLQA